MTIGSAHLSACCQSGFFQSLKDGVAWGLFPLFFHKHDISLHHAGLLVAVYPAVWGTFQLVGGYLSDREDAKYLIIAGLWVEAIALSFIAWSPVDSDPEANFNRFLLGSSLLGIGTALVYPTLHVSLTLPYACDSRR
jgi:MFS family permease